MASEITIAVKLGGDDEGMNPRLRLAIQKAKAVNMPNDNIKRAIQKGAGPSDGTQLEELLFESYAPFGVALLITAVSDNKNRTVPNVRATLGKFSATMAKEGAVAYQFQHVGIVSFEPGCDEEQIFEIATEAGADDVVTQDDGSVTVISSVSDFHGVCDAFETARLESASADIVYTSDSTVNLDADQAKTILTLVERLEDDDDVQAVFGNYEISEEILATLE